MVGLTEALEGLEKALRAEDDEVRLAAVQSIGILGDKRAWDSLVTMLADKSNRVREAAAYGLGSLGDKRASRALIRALADQRESAGVRGMAAEQLGRLGVSRATPRLVAALHDREPEVRFWAAYALGQVADPSALPDLAQLVSDNTTIPQFGTVGAEAAKAIDRIRSRM
jgi:HEAT repeat protein